MSRKPVRPQTRALHKRIREDYEALQKKNIKNGVRQRTTEALMHELAEKYFKSPITIENIVYQSS